MDGRYKSRKFLKFIVGLIAGLIFGYFNMLGMPIGHFIIAMTTGYGMVNILNKFFGEGNDKTQTKKAVEDSG